MVEEYKNEEECDEAERAELDATRKFWETAQKNLHKPPFNSKPIQALILFQEFVFVIRYHRLNRIQTDMNEAS